MGSSKDEVQVSYDIANDFFRLWLDERMNYTSAVFENDTQSLEAAQLNKLRILAEFAHVTPDSKVLDIGCGWGANVEYLATTRGVKNVYGVTLSSAQMEEINRRKIPGVKAYCCDYKDHVPEVTYDAIESICMIDHLVSPEEARRGLAVDNLRKFFRTAHKWTRPGAWFGLQHIVRNRVPRDKKDLEDVYFVTHVVFPGGLNPRIEEVVQAVNPYWEIIEMHSRRVDYQRTTLEWQRRLRDHETEVRTRWGDKVFDDYDRYLGTAARCFDKHYSSLAQYSLKRID
ncbi:MAG TPA: class I SAM-dependent methyltransferase [Polyangiaceae bacterium]